MRTVKETRQKQKKQTCGVCLKSQKKKNFCIEMKTRVCDPKFLCIMHKFAIKN